MYQESDYLRYKTRLAIDAMRLDEELIEHPAMLQDVNEIVADCIMIRDSLARALDIETSSAARDLRRPGDDGKSPPESKIASLVTLDNRVQDAQAELDEANHDLRYWQSLASAYLAKGSSLKRIAELTIAGFLAPNTARRQEMTAARRAKAGTA